MNRRPYTRQQVEDFLTFAIGSTALIVLMLAVAILYVDSKAARNVTFEHYNDGIVCYVYDGHPVNCMQEESLP